jgi:hypothetical protein
MLFTFLCLISLWLIYRMKGSDGRPVSIHNEDGRHALTVDPKSRTMLVEAVDLEGRSHAKLVEVEHHQGELYYRDGGEFRPLPLPEEYAERLRNVLR